MKISDVLFKFQTRHEDSPDSRLLNVVLRTLNYVLAEHSGHEVPNFFERKYLVVFCQNLEKLKSSSEGEWPKSVSPQFMYCLTYFLLDELRIFDESANGPVGEFLSCRVRLDGVHAQILLQQELAIVKATIEDAKHAANYDSVRSYIKEVNNFDLNLEKINALNEDASRLEAAMKKYQDAFNFAGLYHGFSQLKRKKEIEKNLRLVFSFFLGCVALAPLVFKFYVLSLTGWESGSVEGWQKLGEKVSINLELLVTFIAFELLILYFFRITLHSLKSLRAQLLQIDLRMTLCQFIDKYAEYSAQVKKAGGSLDGFESVVFSGLVTMDEKIPSTFDGLDFLQGLIGKAGSKSGAPG